MKKIIILGLISMSVAFSSCKKYLDVEPKQTLADNLVVTNLQGLQTVETAAFNGLQSGDIYGGGIIANTELWADYISTNPISDFSLSQIRSHQFNVYNSQAGGLWGTGYHTILIANTVLKYAPNFASGSQTLVNELMGESYFVRAVAHYEILREFAQPSGYTADDSHLGIPIRLTPASSTTDGQNTPRSSVAEVYAQIVSDLMKADSLLPTSEDFGNSIYVKKYVAEAFLAKVYFSQNKYAQAQDYASRVVSSGAYALNDSVAAIYNLLGSQSTSENVFQIINKVNDYDGTLHGRFSVPPFGSTVPMYMMNTNFASILASAKANNDRRYTALYKRSFGIYFCKKYDAQYQNIPVVRYAEMLLTRAESEAQQGDYTDALADLNLIRTRAGLFPETSTGAALITAIRNERAMELGMEGDHYFEVKRTKGTFHSQFSDYAWNDQTMVYPIPAQEVNQNKSMVQNPGY